MCICICIPRPRLPRAGTLLFKHQPSCSLRDRYVALGCWTLLYCFPILCSINNPTERHTSKCARYLSRYICCQSCRNVEDRSQVSFYKYRSLLRFKTSLPVAKLNESSINCVSMVQPILAIQTVWV